MTIFLSILCFVIGLAALILFHEFGHFVTAKIFNVYCYEFSIGFGKKIYRYKRKNGETYFCVGVIPFGGYVSMFGEDDDEHQNKNDNDQSLNKLVNDSKQPIENQSINIDVEVKPEDSSIDEKKNQKKDASEEDLDNIPFSRSLEGISKWKKLIIMAAGIFCNFLLGYVLYFISVSCFIYNTYLPSLTTYDVSGGETTFQTQLKVLKNNIDEETELLSFQASPIYSSTDKNSVTGALSDTVYINDLPDPYVLFSSSSLNANDLSIDNAIYSTKTTSETTTYRYYLYKRLTLTDDKGSYYAYNTSKSYYDENEYEPIKKINVKFNICKSDFVFKDMENKKDVLGITNTVYNYDSISGTLKMTESGLLEKTGIVSVQDYTRWLGWESFKVAGDKWASGTGAIFNAVGNLFVGKNWDQVGGLISIFTQSKVVFESYPFSYYIQLWGLISVNLAVMNLLPFPGLDGWHICVTLFEGITKKKINAKFKNWASTIGLILLFGLMIAVIIKDIVGLII